ncbi:MAG: phosphodiester glycosidase family protein [Clostridia bacterium]|nr:phosphodiester glycosidase family protein [Clostridia bacterium]
MKRMISLWLALLICGGLGTALAEGGPYDLPISMTPGYEPNPACYTDMGYEDESLSVRMEKVRLEEYGCTVDLAWIKVKSPTQLRTAFHGNAKEQYESEPGALVRAYQAVVAVNGDMFTRRHGMIYRMGIALEQSQSPDKDSLFIDENGDFHPILDSDPAEMVAFLKAGHRIVNSFSFGPVFVMNGEARTIRDDYWFEALARAPRTIIAQVDTLSYLFVEIEGRSQKSRGMTMQQAADYMATLGVQTAYNLDGGNSSIMFFHRKYFDEHYEGSERKTSDIVYVCSAVDPATWKK